MSPFRVAAERGSESNFGVACPLSPTCNCASDCLSALPGERQWPVASDQ
ncbi:hypothetical protein JI435_416630 [Parastagonospora nodorum SN15]|uniref:Uncharacterized protein n=1 Tax=Phaeosphaeria nodorum (strain SN15 / ATCC MYA-4574 / FGSC 10173) TaxID=321614 RepID=A0A7U2F9X9_PHANO|nr:hypothetical protein JI435_416630 [Parastagonospora nodorum SN15]